MKTAYERALAYLAARQNTDGGWGYLPDQASRAEPTSYALLALRDAPAKLTRETKAVEWFLHNRSDQGALTHFGGQPDQWGTLLAFFALRRLQLAPELTAAWLRNILGWYGQALDMSKLDAATLRQNVLNHSLRAWSWAPNTFSWVEPTAYGMIALKTNGLKMHERVAEAEALLVDRACAMGGWNYGNKDVLGVKLEPMPTNTAYALIALQDAVLQRELTSKAADYLETELHQRQSALALALGVLSLQLYGRSVAALTEALVKRQATNGGWRENAHLTALAALALATQVNGSNIYRFAEVNGDGKTLTAS